MFKIKTDAAKNRMVITLMGFLSHDEASAAYEAIVKESSALQPGFDVINDISNFRLGQEQAGVILKSIQRFFIEKKVRKVVRVVGASQQGLIQFANHSLEANNYNLKYVPTIKEAEQFLDEP